MSWHVCHVMQLAEKWLTVAHFRDPETCDDMDVCFLPYELVVRINVSLHHPAGPQAGLYSGERGQDAGDRIIQDGGVGEEHVAFRRWNGLVDGVRLGLGRFLLDRFHLVLHPNREP